MLSFGMISIFFSARSTRAFVKKYNLEFTAATFLIIDYDESSNEIACEWQNCMGGQVFLQELNCDQKVGSRLRLVVQASSVICCFTGK